MFGESHILKGRVQIVLKDQTARVLTRRSVRNTIANTGREMVAQLFAGQANDKSVKVRVGKSDSDFLPQHTVDDRNFIEITSIDNPAVEVDAANNQAILSFSSTFAANEANEPLKEAGIVFVDADPAVPEILYNGVTFAVIDKQSGDILTLNWEIIF
jgi:hypothetical protein